MKVLALVLISLWTIAITSGFLVFIALFDFLIQDYDISLTPQARIYIIVAKFGFGFFAITSLLYVSKRYSEAFPDKPKEVERTPGAHVADAYYDEE